MADIVETRTTRALKISKQLLGQMYDSREWGVLEETYAQTRNKTLYCIDQLKQWVCNLDKKKSLSCYEHALKHVVRQIVRDKTTSTIHIFLERLTSLAFTVNDIGLVFVLYHFEPLLSKANSPKGGGDHKTFRAGGGGGGRGSKEDKGDCLICSSILDFKQTSVHFLTPGP